MEWKQRKMELLRRWDQLQQEAGGNPWPELDERRLFGYFELFEPRGAGMERFFEGLSAGDQLSKRLRTEWFHDHEVGPIIGSEIERLAREHQQSMQKIAKVVGSERAMEISDPQKPVLVTTDTWEDPAPDEVGEMLECVSEFLEGFEQREIWVAREAYYSLSNDYFVAYFLMWPAFASQSTINDPLRSYWELYIRDVQCGFTQDGLYCQCRPEVTDLQR